MIKSIYAIVNLKKKINANSLKIHSETRSLQILKTPQDEIISHFFCDFCDIKREEVVIKLLLDCHPYPTPNFIFKIFVTTYHHVSQYALLNPIPFAMFLSSPKMDQGLGGPSSPPHPTSQIKRHSMPLLLEGCIFKRKNPPNL